MDYRSEMNTEQTHIDFMNKEFLIDVVKRSQDGDAKAMEAVYKNYKEKWKKEYRRYYKIADITIQVDSDIPITDNTFHQKYVEVP